jgi:hypothetical protein
VKLSEFVPIIKEDGMKHISKKAWVFITIAIVAGSAVFALKKPIQKEKCSHLVVDRLVNQLVCEINLKSQGGSHRFPRGILGFSKQKRLLGQRQGFQRHEKRRPIGGDFISKVL